METEIFKFKLSGRTFVIVDWANVYGWFSDPNSKTYLGWEIDSKKLFSYLKSYTNIADINFYYGIERGNKKSEEFYAEIRTIGYNVPSKPKEVKWVPAVLETTAHFKVLVRRLFDVLDNVKNTNSAVSNSLYDLVKRLEKILESVHNMSATGEPTYTFFDERQARAIYELIEGLDSDLRKLNIDITKLQASLKEPVQRRKCDFDVEISRDVYNNLENFETIIIFSGDGDYAALAEDLIEKGKKTIVVFARGHKGKEYEDFKTGLFLCSVKRLRQFIAK